MYPQFHGRKMSLWWVTAEWSWYYRHWTEKSNPAKKKQLGAPHGGSRDPGLSTVRQGHDQAMWQTLRAPSFQILTFSQISLQLLSLNSIIWSRFIPTFIGDAVRLTWRELYLDPIVSCISECLWEWIIITESQNHRMVGAGRDLCGSSSPTLLLKQGHLQWAVEDLVQVGLEYLQRRRLHNLPGQQMF